MEMSPILSPSGDPVFCAGGKHAYRTAQYRGYVVSLEWARRGRQTIPIMVIWAERNVLHRGGEPCNGQWVIARSALYEFVSFDKDGHCTGSASDYCISQCKQAMPLLGKDVNDKQALMSLIDTVLKFADELHYMPVAPPRVKKALAGEAIWELTTINKRTGKTISEASV